MAVKTAKKKDPAAVALGRKGGKKGGPARAASLTPKQRSESARKAVQARWAIAKRGTFQHEALPAIGDTSDHAALTLLKRIKAAKDRTELRHLTDQLQRVIFHKQYKNV
jgi:hypothetical protein